MINNWYKTKAERIVGTKVKFLGKGKNAETFIFKKSGKIFVIKILNEPFLEELYHFSALSKMELIPKIYEIKEDYIIMDYINGFTIKDILSEKIRLTSNQKKKLFKNIKNELYKWHSYYVSHGDLSPENIIILNNQLNVIFIDPVESDLDNSMEFVEKDFEKIKELEKKLLY